MSDRSPCACRSCPCPGSAFRAGDPCPLCARGLHRPTEAVQEHHRRGLEHWIRIMPVTLGSSGLSVAQLRQSRDVWDAWHARSDCPRRAARAA